MTSAKWLVLLIFAALTAAFAARECHAPPQEPPMVLGYVPMQPLYLPGQAAGATAYFDGGSDAWVALPPGDGGQLLQQGTGAPQWTSGWATDFDCDLTAQSTQVLNVDTSYTICGISWTKLNSAHDASDGGVKVTNDAGLVITPDSVSNISSSTFTAPTLRAPITSFSPLATLSTPLRFSFWIPSSNEAANSDQAIGGIFIYNGSYNNQLTLQFFRGYSGATDGWGAWFTVLQSNVTTTTTSIPFTTNRVAVVTMPGGLLAGTSTLQVGATVDAGAWPAASSLVYVASPTITAGSSAAGANSSSGQRTIADWNLFLSADRAGSATSGFAATFGRVRVERQQFN